MNRRQRTVTATVLTSLACLLIAGCCRGPQPGKVQDEAKRAGRIASMINPPQETQTTLQ